MACYTVGMKQSDKEINEVAVRTIDGLGGVAAVADRIGRNRTTVQNWRRRGIAKWALSEPEHSWLLAAYWAARRELEVDLMDDTREMAQS